MHQPLLTAADRLIVAFDFPLTERRQVWNKNVELALALRKTGVTVKVNSGLRACGYDLIDVFHEYGLKVMADLKLYDIADTLKIDGMLLREAKPEFLTVVCSTGLKAMKTLKAELPDTEIMGVTVLTDLDDADSRAMFSCSALSAVLRFAVLGLQVPLDGLVASAKEVPALLENDFELFFTLNTPAIRPVWAQVPEDGQNPARSRTPEEAIRAGATRIVVGRPITLAKNPYDAVMRTLEEIDRVLSLR